MHVKPRTVDVLQRLTSFALAALLALTTIVSIACISELSDHDCEGDGCEICLILEISKAALSTAFAPAHEAAAAILGLALLFVIVLGYCTMTEAETPVSLKVRLDI